MYSHWFWYPIGYDKLALGCQRLPLPLLIFLPWILWCSCEYNIDWGKDQLVSWEEVQDCHIVCNHGQCVSLTSSKVLEQLGVHRPLLVAFLSTPAWLLGTKILGRTESTHVIHNVHQLMELWIIPSCAFWSQNVFLTQIHELYNWTWNNGLGNLCIMISLICVVPQPLIKTQHCFKCLQNVSLKEGS